MLSDVTAPAFRYGQGTRNWPKFPSQDSDFDSCSIIFFQVRGQTSLRSKQHMKGSD